MKYHNTLKKANHLADILSMLHAHGVEAWVADGQLYATAIWVETTDNGFTRSHTKTVKLRQDTQSIRVWLGY